MVTDYVSRRFSENEQSPTTGQCAVARQARSSIKWAIETWTVIGSENEEKNHLNEQEAKKPRAEQPTKNLTFAYLFTSIPNLEHYVRLSRLFLD